MNILKIIKKHKAIRQYTKKSIPKKTLDKIIEAGRWAPSIHGFQPWFFVVITNADKITNISNILKERAKSLGAVARVLLNSTATTIMNAKSLIAVYGSGIFVKWANKFVSVDYTDIAQKVELSAISAAVQNMILVAEELGLGSCWMEAPLFCNNEISKLLSLPSDLSLIALVSLGYPNEKGARSIRKPIKEVSKFIK